MTQEDKELLLKDLCSRLPYGVKVKTILKEPYTLKGLSDTEYGGVMGHLLGKFVPNNVSPKTVNYPLEQFKPYLFPLSSMTEEQKEEMANKGIAYYQVFDGIGSRISCLSFFFA